jgi:tetratricopeptide (TPR) repeat protein
MEAGACRALEVSMPLELPLSNASPAAAAAFEHAVMGYIGYRADTPLRVTALLESHPDLAMAHVLKGYLLLMSFKLANVPSAAAAVAEAREAAREPGWQERAHVAALAHWIEGDLDAALAAWEEILDAHPRDLLAFRIHHFNAFWLGRPATMAASVERVLPAWSEALPGYATVLACRAFAHEELGNYALAEATGRQAIELDPRDLWAAHAVAHVLEMQGRRAEGIGWLERLSPHWDGGNNLKHHLWWHQALYHLEQGEYAKVLALYDQGFRNLGSPLTLAQPDLYIDIQNAASMLFRLEQLGQDVGGRWQEIAEHAAARVGDCLSPFTLPHWMLALAATRRFDVAERWIEAIREHGASQAGTNAALVRDCALPICRAVLARARGEFRAACEHMRPALAGMHALGGSHAQQAVLEQLFLDCAVKAGASEDAALLLDRVGRRHPLPPFERVGFREAVRALRP